MEGDAVVSLETYFSRLCRSVSVKFFFLGGGGQIQYRMICFVPSFLQTRVKKVGASTSSV